MKKLNINELPEFISLNGKGYNFNTNELREIKVVETKYKIRQSIAKLVGHCVKYKLADWLDRIIKIKAMGNTITEARYTVMMGEIEGNKHWLKISNKKKISQTEKSYILKYGEKKGKAIWNEMNLKRSESGFKTSYWIKKGMSAEEAQEKVISISKKGSLAGNQTQEYLRKTDYAEWAKKMPNTIEFYLAQGFTETESNLFVSDRQSTFSKKICIDKLGLIKGIKRWEERQEKWLNTIYYIDKDGFTKSKLNTNRAGVASKASMAVFRKIMIYLDNNSMSFLVGDGDKTEFCIKTNNKVYMYDFTITDLKLIFEYNGERFHPNPKWKIENPKKWEKWRMPYKSHENITAQTKYEFDCVKNIEAEILGFKVVNLWSSNTVSENQRIMLGYIKSQLSL